MSKGLDNTPSEKTKKEEKTLLFLLTCVQFFNILDFVVIMPLAPMLMREYAISPTQFALLASSYSLSSGAIGLFYSAFADRFNRKSALLVTLVGFIISTFFCIISTDYHMLLGARIIAGVFGGILTPSCYAIVTDIIPYSRRGSALGVLLASFSITSILGIPTGLAIADLYGWRYTFAFVAAGATLTTFFIYFVLPSIPVSGISRNAKDTFKNMYQVIVDKQHRSAFMCIILFSSSGFVLFPFLSAYCVKNVGIAESDLKYIYLAGGLLTIITSRYLGRLTDRFDPVNVATPALLISFPVILLYTQVENISLPLLLVISTLFMASINGRFVPIMTLVTQAPNSKNRGTFMGVMSSVRAFSAGISTTVAGIIVTESAQNKLENFQFMGYYSIFITIVGMYFVVKLKHQIGSSDAASS